MTDKPATTTVNRILLESGIIRVFSLPNGDKIVSLRESTLCAGLKAANEALREERSS